MIDYPLESNSDCVNDNELQKLWDDGMDQYQYLQSHTDINVDQEYVKLEELIKRLTLINMDMIIINKQFAFLKHNINRENMIDIMSLILDTIFDQV